MSSHRKHLSLLTRREADEEKEPRARQSRQAPHRHFFEQFSAGQCATCGAFRALDCVCCVECNLPATHGKWCDVHEEAHRIDVARELRESDEQAEMLKKQIGWLDVLRECGAL